MHCNSELAQPGTLFTLTMFIGRNNRELNLIAYKEWFQLLEHGS